MLAIANYKKENNLTQPITSPVVVVPEAPKPYSITEGFETGSKTSYAVANVQLNTGLWSFNNSLIDGLAADGKNGVKSDTTVTK
ncbi:hypothetical protein NAF17_14555 [Mucilaginibacter sp. RB4R14]|uniref:hypothetical protein n=1 Tax=Mucilaginibacter aurantiaciroseus TaxID=2949308 RepID=UPI002091173E|nr:hypothetical protein [Mucilaginibacter aurantiaciroseus]MCO5936761.1 hypothetical protein [Mucilaginibacter aurantiaciroseus]